MTNRNDISLPFSKVQEFVRPVWNAPRGLRAALAAGALGLAALAFAVPQGANVTTLPELGIDAGPPLSVSNAASYGFSGTCSENLQTVSLSVRHIATGSGVEAPAVPCLGGIWQLAGLNLSGLAEGLLAVSVSHNDLAGQRVELNASLAKGGSLPRVGIDAPAPIHAGNLDAYTLSGSCSEEGQKLALSLIDGLGRNLLIPLIAQPVCIGQRWSAVLPGLSALQDGAITLTVTHSDIRSGASTLTTQAMKNGVMPGLSIDPLLFVKEANQASFPVGGACSEAKQPVYLSISDNNKVTVYGSSLCSGKRWSLPALNLTSLAGGELRFVATHTSAMQLGRTVEQAGLKDSVVAGAAVTNAATTLASTAFAGQQAGSTAQAKAQSLLPTQSITFNSLSKKALGDVPFTVSATASSGLHVSFSSLTPLVCTTTGSQGNTVTLLLMGTCTIQANQPGNAQTSAATPVEQSFTVGVQARGAMMGKPAIAAGGNHTIAIKGDTLKSVWTWGDNERGQLGDGTILMRSTPVQVPNLSADGVGAGASHSVALKTDGSIVAWGSNDFGQLGDGTTTTRSVPTALTGTTLPVFSAIAVGANHTLALTVNHEVWAWGANSDGQIQATTPYSPTPTKIGSLANVQAIAAGANHSLALINGEVWVWGREAGHAPQRVSTSTGPLNGVAAIAAGGDHSLALKDGGVWAWGSDWAGQLGNGPTTTGYQTMAASVPGLTSGVGSISAGNAFSMALKIGGTATSGVTEVWAWGRGAAGQIGTAGTDLESPAQIISPAQITSLSNVSALAAGDNHALALKNGQVLAWGDNGRGQLGDGKLTFRQEPVTISGLPAPVNVFAGAYHLVSKGAVGTPSNDRSWGSSWKGQLAETAVLPVQRPLYKLAPTTSLITTTPLAAGAAHTLAGVQSVGDNLANQLGQTLTGVTLTATLANVSGLPAQVSSVAAGVRHSLAAFGKDLWVWGANEAGQLGNGNTLIVDPTKATQLSDPFSIGVGGTATITALAAGAAHSVASVNNKVYVWGSNLFGQLGKPTTTLSLNSPSELAPCSSAPQIAAGWYHTVALCNGSVLTWGSNTMGQLGHAADAATNAVSFPISGVTITKIAAGAHHTLAMGSVGTPAVTKVWAWGSNQYGQLGDSSTTNRSTPIEIVSSSGATDIAAGAGYSVIIKGATTVIMGDGRDGQLGLGNPGSDDAAEAIRPTPEVMMIDLSGGPGVQISQLSGKPLISPEFSVTSSKVGTAYWVVIESAQHAPSLGQIKTNDLNYGVVGRGNIGTADASPQIKPTTASLSVNKAYRLFVCVVETGGSTCTGNAASLDFVTTTPLAVVDLTVAVTGDAGFVTSNTANSAGEVIYCDSQNTVATCKKAYSAGQSVTLTATKNSSGVTVAWSGGGCSGSGDTCTVPVSVATTVTATFTRKTPISQVKQLQPSTYTLSEAAPTTITITITRTGNLDIVASLNIVVAGGTAEAKDYTLSETSVGFVAGQSTATFTITAQPGSGGKTVKLKLTSLDPSKIKVNGASITPILMLLLD
jgi:alpha-tubulin suppressor-like RCC1 family protein